MIFNIVILVTVLICDLSMDAPPTIFYGNYGIMIVAISSNGFKESLLVKGTLRNLKIN